LLQYDKKNFDLDNLSLQTTVTALVTKFKAAGIYVKINYIHNFTTEIFTAGVSTAGGVYVA